MAVFGIHLFKKLGVTCGKLGIIRVSAQCVHVHNCTADTARRVYTPPGDGMQRLFVDYLCKPLSLFMSTGNKRGRPSKRQKGTEIVKELSADVVVRQDTDERGRPRAPIVEVAQRA